MRRLSLVLFLGVMVATAAFALDLNAVKQPQAIPSGTTSAYVDSATSVSGLANAFTVYSYDASDDFYVTLYRSGVADTAQIFVPAGKSLLIPAGQPEYRSASGYYLLKIGVTSHADTVQVIPWVR